MLDFRTVKIGDRMKFTADDFDGHVEHAGIVVETKDDHATVYADGTDLWFDDATAYRFEMIKPAGETLDFSDLNMSMMVFGRLPGNCLRGANFRNANLAWADFSLIDLRGADFRDANVMCADFRWCDLRDANLLGCNIHAAYLRRANLTDAVIDSADMHDIESLALEGAIEF